MEAKMINLILNPIWQPEKTKWYIKFLLFFCKATYGTDNDQNYWTKIGIKQLLGKMYVVSHEQIEKPQLPKSEISMQDLQMPCYIPHLFEDEKTVLPKIENIPPMPKVKLKNLAK